MNSSARSDGVCLRDAKAKSSYTSTVRGSCPVKNWPKDLSRRLSQAPHVPTSTGKDTQHHWSSGKCRSQPQ